jgi:undecaprenyl-diphosphatase
MPSRLRRDGAAGLRGRPWFEPRGQTYWHALMNELQALLLGIVQGLTEFLPISSSGHLILVPWLLDFRYLEEHPDFNKTFDVAVHVGTLIAVLFYFRRDIAELAVAAVRSGVRRRVETSRERLAWSILVATIPAALAGALAADAIERDLGEPWQIAILLAFFGLLLAVADRLPERRDVDEIGVRSALAVGVAQAIALAPGTSRSGITITAARALGLTRDAAARFSFLLLAPVVAGASVFEGVDALRDGLPAGSGGPFAVGVVSAAASGFAAIWVLLRFVRTHSYDVFVWYRLIAAAVILSLIATGVQEATF